MTDLLAGSKGLRDQRDLLQELPKCDRPGARQDQQDGSQPEARAALLLQGLDQRLLNDGARAREVIIHGADQVSAPFIASLGRLGGAGVALPRRMAKMARVISFLADAGLLYVHGG